MSSDRELLLRYYVPNYFNYIDRYYDTIDWCIRKIHQDTKYLNYIEMLIVNIPSCIIPYLKHATTRITKSVILAYKFCQKNVALSLVLHLNM